MVPTVQQARTSLLIAAAGVVVATALLLSPRRDRIVDCDMPSPTAGDVTMTARLTSSKILPGAQTQDVAVTITANAPRSQTRPPLSLAVVIDRSGSMNGVPMRNAKAAAAELVGQLAEADAFTIVTFSSGDEVIAPIARATAANKAAARAAIDRIWDDGGTCTSCGLLSGASELGRSPIVGGLRRIVLISDGQANVGVWHRDELAQLASKTASNGVSISSVGVGLDFDEVTMTKLADVGRGTYYFVEDTANLGAMFQRELGGLTETIASDLHLVVDVRGPDLSQAGHGDSVEIEEAYGYPMTREGTQVIIPVADLRAGETRKVVLRVRLAAPHTGSISIATLRLGYRRVEDGAARTVAAQAVAEVVTDGNEVAASVDHDATRASMEAQSARALEEATVTYEKQGYRAAQQVLQRHMDSVRANKVLDPASAQELERAVGDVMQDFAAAPPAKAVKATRAKAYELVH